MDDFGQIFRRLFGLPPGRGDGYRRRGDWNGEDRDDRMGRSDDGDEFFGNNRHPNERGFDFFFGNRGGEHDLDGMFEHFHSHMWRNMESLHRQMEDMMRGFGAVEFPPDFDSPSQQDPMVPGGSIPSDHPSGSDNNIRIWFGTPSPFFRHGEGMKEKSPRDYMLKENDSESSVPRDIRPVLPAPSHPGHEHPTMPFNSRPGMGFGKREEKREDSDLDGKLSEKEVLDLIKKTPEPQVTEPVPSQPRMSWGKSVSVTRVQRPDGTVEEKRVVRDSSGHEESTVKKSMGDQSYTVTTITGEDGRSEKKETFENMDDKDIESFEKKWRTPFTPVPRHPSNSLIDPAQQPVQIDPQDRDLFSKLFGWRDK